MWGIRIVILLRGRGVKGSGEQHANIWNRRKKPEPRGKTQTPAGPPAAPHPPSRNIQNKTAHNTVQHNTLTTTQYKGSATQCNKTTQCSTTQHNNATRTWNRKAGNDLACTVPCHTSSHMLPDKAGLATSSSLYKPKRYVPR